MDNLKEKAIEISNKFPFSPFSTAASAANGHKESDGNVSECDNHLDVQFMSLLDQGAHLDINRMPL